MKNCKAAALALLAISVISCEKKQDSSNDATTASASVQEVVTTEEDSVASATPVASTFPIAYVNVDTLLLKYDLAKKLNESLLKTEEKKRKELNSAQQKLAAELEVFQQKYQAGGFLTKESFEQEQARLTKKDQELVSLSQRLTQEMFDEQQKANKRIKDSLDAVLAVYNADGHLKLILSNTSSDNILFSDQSLNITNDVLEQMNERYKSTLKK